MASDYGHLDMLDAGTSCGFVCNSCAKSPTSVANETFRIQIAGSLVKFFNASLKGASKGYDGVLDAFEDLSLKVDKK